MFGYKTNIYDIVSFSRRIIWINNYKPDPYPFDKYLSEKYNEDKTLYIKMIEEKANILKVSFGFELREINSPTKPVLTLKVNSKSTIGICPNEDVIFTINGNEKIFKLKDITVNTKDKNVYKDLVNFSKALEKEIPIVEIRKSFWELIF